MKEHLKTENSKTMNNNNKKRQEEIKEFDETQEKKDKDKILSEMKNHRVPKGKQMPTKFNEGIEKRQENKQKNENNIMKKSKKEQKESSRRGRETR